MKTRLSILLVAVLVLCFAVTAVMAGECKGKEGDEKEATVTIDQVPTAVAQTLLQAAQTGTIDEIVKEEEKGVVTYEADITKDGKKFEAKVAADGKLLAMEEEKDEQNEQDGENED
jgi:hypothetical protein